MYDCLVLNGCTDGDKDGNFTFIGGQGKSVIDYCALNNDWHDHITRFEVQSKNFSDHMPIVVEWADNMTSTVKNLQLIPRLKWKKNEINLYRNNLDNNLSLLNDSSDSTELLSNKLISCIRNSANKPTSCRNKSYKQEWFDKECMKARNKSFTLLNAVRNSDCQNLKQWYIEENTRYKNLCLKKKTEYENQQALSLSQTKDCKEFWKITKMINGSNFTIGLGVSAEDLAGHFKNILCGKSSDQFLYAEPLLTDEILDSEITFAEIQAVILKAKNDKAPGEDGIAYEFFKNGTEALIIKLKSLFNDVFNKQEVPTSFKTAVIFPIHKKG
ncbi:uncharacterized protein LOC129921023 [Episyrphus balteatus]|uniref:uncharacterized protein LOC129921023 n=1 Tax=Episyrphus balteatus TaxID=286459 RepID=UPI0024865254|nr:uncharacterized protein LOC129921023 [Episyrphus balteatus]